MVLILLILMVVMVILKVLLVREIYMNACANYFVALFGHKVLGSLILKVQSYLFGYWGHI